MKFLKTTAFCAITLLAQPAMGEAPHIVTDIAPIHSLVSMVLGDKAEVTLLVKDGASPHDFSLRPSHARALQNADLVFWTGPDLAPWLEGVIRVLSTPEKAIALSQIDGVQVLSMRENAVFASHSGDEDHAAHDDDTLEHDAHTGHDHSGTDDPHTWLDPENALVWLDEITRDLSAVDPENSTDYAKNGAEARIKIQHLIGQIEAKLATVQNVEFVVYHDAYQYFETRFKLAGQGALMISDASAASPARLKEIREIALHGDVKCVFSESQFSTGLVDVAIEGTDAKAAQIDPIGVNIALGADFYPQLLTQMAEDFSRCLSQ